MGANFGPRLQHRAPLQAENPTEALGVGGGAPKPLSCVDSHWDGDTRDEGALGMGSRGHWAPGMGFMGTRGHRGWGRERSGDNGDKGAPGMGMSGVWGHWGWGHWGCGGTRNGG